MIAKRKTKIVRSVKEGDFVNASYAETTKSKRYSFSRHIDIETQHFVGQFSKAEWRRIKTNRILDFISGYSPWVMWVLAILGTTVGIATMAISHDSLLVGGIGFLILLAGFGTAFLAVGDFMGSEFNESMLGNFIKRIGCEPTRLNAEVTVKDFVKVNGETFANHMRKVSEEEFLNIVQSFVKWDKAEQAYNELSDTIGYRHEYDDVKLYDFTNEKRQELWDKISANKSEAKELEKSFGKDTRSVKLLKALQKADNAIAA